MREHFTPIAEATAREILIYYSIPYRTSVLVPLLFREANPMPIKHCRWRQGLIASPECRLPLTRISEGLAAELEPALRTDSLEPAEVPSAARRT